jgi:hypothetical protein
MDDNVTNPQQPSTAAPQPAPVASRPASEYEFTEADDVLFLGLAWQMNFVGLFALGIGIFVILIGAFLEHAGSILSGALYSVIGIWTHRASVSFRKIAETRGKDISHLLHAIHDLRKLYSLQFWICVLSLIVAVASLVVVILVYRPRFVG